MGGVQKGFKSADAVSYLFISVHMHMTTATYWQALLVLKIGALLWLTQIQLTLVSKGKPT